MTIEHNAPQMPLPELSDIQARVFACLIEKNLATPNNYPLTINSLLLACNQKTNRHPVMSLTEGEVARTANELTELSLAKVDYGERAKKVTHLAMRELNLSREEAAVICMLILREPLTINEIKARTEKMVSFESLEEIENLVNELSERRYPLTLLIPKASGQREDRYTHLLCGEVDIEQFQTISNTTKSSNSRSNLDELNEKIELLEARIKILEEKIA